MERRKVPGLFGEEKCGMGMVNNMPYIDNIQDFICSRFVSHNISSMNSVIFNLH